MTQSRRRTRRIDPDIYQAIVDLASRPTPFSGPRIREQLELNFDAERVPSLRTIQDVIREVAPPPDRGERWSLATSDGPTAAAILPVIAELVRDSGGKFNGIGQPLVKHIVTIRAACPEISATDALRMAGRYTAAEEAGASTEHLDTYLALGAWDDKVREEAIRRGLLPIDWWIAKGERRG